MSTVKERRNILISSLILTLIIFGIGISLNYMLDFYRIDAVNEVIRDHEISSDAYLVHQEFIDTFGGEECRMLDSRITELKEELHQVGVDLSTYGTHTFFTDKDFDFLKRKYFLLELKFLDLVSQLNEKCSKPYLPILFFYKIDDDFSERQGFILDEISEAYKNKVIVLTFDIDYEDEPLIPLIMGKYNITDAPTLLINNDIKREGIAYTGEINATLLKIMREADPYGKGHNFSLVLDATGADKDEFVENYLALLAKNISNFAKGDIILMLGRVLGNNTMICQSLQYYDKFEPKTSEQKALLYETYAAVNCGRNRRAFLLEAAQLWEKEGNDLRAEIDTALAYGDKIEFKTDIKEIHSSLSIPDSFSKITLGTTYIHIDDSDIIISQSDRVNRDWLSYQIIQSPFDKKILSVFSERLTYNDTELLRDIGWHEGGRLLNMEESGFLHEIATGTLVVMINGTWYAPNEKGIFMFEVPIDKVVYPTTRFLREDIAVIMDTHGVNMIVEQALRKKATVVIACCDHPGKIKAVEYLSSKGVKSLCFPDKFLYLALGKDVLALGSPPLNIEEGKAVLGGQSLSFSKDEKIIVMNATDYPYALWYYQTPTHYFSEMEKYTDLDVDYITIDDFYQMSDVIDAARNNEAHVIAVRVFNSDDYMHVKEWLLEDETNRAVLFHSSPYPYGLKLMSEFPEQTTFDDPNPIFSK